MTRLSWLHLTDLHFGLDGQAPLWPNVKQAFFDDLGHLHDRTGPWQLVLFTGDFVQIGAKTEFDKLDEKVLEPLWARMKELGSEPHLLAIPGNHDLIRPSGTKPPPALRLLLRPNFFAEISDEFYEDPVNEYREIINTAFAEYAAWWRRTPYRHPAVQDGLLPGEFSVSLAFDDVAVGVVGLNTTFLQLQGGDYLGRLAWDLRQFHAACTGDPKGDGPGWVREHHACILMTHQGPEWLDGHSRDTVYPEINPAGRFVVHLFGHMHENLVRGTSVAGSKVLWQWQGNSMFGLEKFGEPPTVDRRHGYSAGTFAFDLVKKTVNLRHWPRKAVRKGAGGWECDRDAEGCSLDKSKDDGGTEAVAIALNHRARKPTTDRRPNGDGDMTIVERQALEIYSQAAGSLWDIVDLAGLPEDDRHLAMQQFLLRQLFVPLRLTIESPGLEEPTDEGVDDLEQRRLQKRLFDAGRNDGRRPSRSSTKTFSIGQRLGGITAETKRGRRNRKRGERQLPTVTQEHRIIILGDPGSGKSTLLRWLATAFLMRRRREVDFKMLPDIESLPENNWVPVLVRCRDLDKSRIENHQVSIEDVLRQMLSKLEIRGSQVEILVSLLRKLMSRGDLLLLVDGLDEITDPQLRAQFCAWIEAVATQFPCPLVATSRIVGYREMKRRLQGGFEHATLADLRPDAKDEFVRRWCHVTIAEPSRRRAEASKLMQAVHGQHSDRIERLTGNPMLLTTLALVQRKVGKLPSKRHKLYWEAVGVLLNWRADVDEPIDPDEALPQLEYVAYAMCDRGIQQLRRDELLALLESVRSEYVNIRPLQQRSPQEFLMHLERRTGLLVESGYEQHNGHPVPVYEFRHLTFQEYLAALAIIEGRFPGHNPNNTLADRIAPLAGRVVPMRGGLVFEQLQVAENWGEALRLCIACCNDDDVDSSLRAIAAREIGPADASTEIVEPNSKQSSGANAQPNDPEIVAHRDARPRAILAALCLADEPNVSQNAAISVLQAFASQAKEGDGGGMVRTGVDRAAMELAASAWREPLLNALVKEFESRRESARDAPGGLAGMVGEVGFPVDASGRENWMGDCGLRLNDPDTSAATIAALTVMNVAYHENAVLVDGLIDGLLALLARGGPATHAAAWALSWLSKKDGHKASWVPTGDQIAELRKYINAPKTDAAALRWLCWIIGAAHDKSAIAALLKLLTHSYSRARAAAADALGRIGDGSATEPLKPCLKDPDSDVRMSTLGALGLLSGERIFSQLVSRDLDASPPWLDPDGAVDTERVSRAATKLNLSDSTIREHYEAIAREFGFKLAWNPST